MGDISQSNKLQGKLTDKKMKIQSLKSKCKLLQMRLEMYGTHLKGFASQPLMRHSHPPYPSSLSCFFSFIFLPKLHDLYLLSTVFFSFSPLYSLH
ncbi:hypothetical protein VP01_1065g5 [Puccinia sorghi]|uniref:Uncharacterized protein n=1 Tax=Puccinia sorghi TaxID=27349 RepID=A0A0L6VTT3_9BASI|nr:hypothetical protein VP01_1065g5 [Puccinia sorghi]